MKDVAAKYAQVNSFNHVPPHACNAFGRKKCPIFAAFLLAMDCPAKAKMLKDYQTTAKYDCDVCRRGTVRHLPIFIVCWLVTVTQSRLTSNPIRGIS